MEYEMIEKKKSAEPQSPPPQSKSQVALHNGANFLRIYFETVGGNNETGREKKVFPISRFSSRYLFSYPVFGRRR